ncbi:MAG: ABC transporter ATP-binding protein [Chloroflexota bacterium]
MSEAAITLEGVRKRFGPVQALDGMDLSVPSGSIFGFLGPNGAGKTTSIRVLTGFIRAGEGQVRVLGLDPWRQAVDVHQRTGFLPDAVAFGSGFTGQEFLDYTARLHGLSARPARQRELLERLELSGEALGRKVKYYSSGMAKKVGLVRAMQHAPELLIMDEPTEALDPLMRQALFAILREERERGATVFFSSHVLSDVEEVCEEVALVRAGRVIRTGGVEALRAAAPRVLTVRLRGEPPAVMGVPGAEEVGREGPLVRLRVTAEAAEVARALAALDIEDFTYERPDLEELFLTMYGDGAAPERAAEVAGA